MRFIQMWIIPRERGLEPSIEQRTFAADARRGRWLPVVVPAPGYGATDAPANPDAVTVHQDASLYATLLDAGQAVSHGFRQGFDGYLFAVHGDAHVATDGDAVEVDRGGAVKVEGERVITVRARDRGAELLLVETRAVDRG
jgi:redox-sensitive bicupin YhaK (pirin superfamily)